MKSLQLEISKYESVNFLWCELIEDYGFEKARKLLSQAIDLQKMNDKENLTLPIIISGTGGLALLQKKLLKEVVFEENSKDIKVLIFNLKKKYFQILNDA